MNWECNDKIASILTMLHIYKNVNVMRKIGEFNWLHRQQVSQTDFNM